MSFSYTSSQRKGILFLLFIVGFIALYKLIHNSVIKNQKILPLEFMKINNKKPIENDFLKINIKKRFYFFDNLDEQNQIIKTKKKTLNIIISKSGNTLETIVNENIY